MSDYYLHHQNCNKKKVLRFVNNDTMVIAFDPRDPPSPTVETTKSSLSMCTNGVCCFMMVLLLLLLLLLLKEFGPSFSLLFDSFSLLVAFV
jgi:hypothetical protein